MKKIKRLLVLCLACAMLVGIMAIPASAVFSTQNASDYVDQLYTGLLGRPADDAGKLHFVDELYTQGVSAGTVAQEFLGSAEFRGRQLNNKQYIRALYKGLLGRTPDSTGMNSFLGFMECGQSRAWVYQQILASAEFKDRCENHFNMYVGTYPTGDQSANPNPTSVNTTEAAAYVEGLYQAFLGRSADKAGKEHWLNMLSLKKLNAAGVAAAIASSAEFNAKSYTNSEFIKRCYQGLLGRDPDPEGYTHFVSLMNAGKTRSWVFSAICSSAEFQRRAVFAPGVANITPGTVTEQQAGNVSGTAVNTAVAANYVTRLYMHLLNRSVDPNGAEVQGWVNKLVARELSAAGVAAAIASSPEAKNIGLTREQYVERLYGALLGRSSDVGGKGYFVNALQAGYSRSWVFAKMVASTEFQSCSLFAEMNVVPGTINYTSYDMG